MTFARTEDTKDLLKIGLGKKKKLFKVSEIDPTLIVILLRLYLLLEMLLIILNYC